MRKRYQILKKKMMDIAVRQVRKQRPLQVLVVGKEDVNGDGERGRCVILVAGHNGGSRRKTETTRGVCRRETGQEWR